MKNQGKKNRFIFDNRHTTGIHQISNKKDKGFHPLKKNNKNLLKIAPHSKSTSIIAAENKINLSTLYLNFHEQRYIIPFQKENYNLFHETRKIIMNDLKLKQETKYTIPDVPSNINIYADVVKRASVFKSYVLQSLQQNDFQVE